MRLILSIICLVIFCQVGFGQIESTQSGAREYRKKDINDVRICQVGKLHMQNYVSPADIELFGSGSLDNCVTIYVETDYYTYNQFNQDEFAVVDWINAIFDEVAIIYANEDINIRVTSLFVPTNTSQDWSSQYSDVSSLLSRFGAVRGDTINGRLKHFVTLRPLGGGVAWLGTLCFNQTFYGDSVAYGPYAVSAAMNKTVIPYPNYSWNVEVVSHEMGHNLGSPHTHDCLWGPQGDLAIDDCYTNNCPEIEPIEYGTVMSYCHLSSVGIDFTKGFGFEAGNLIRSRVASASCLQSCCPGRLTLTGSIEGFHIADTIVLIDVTSMSDLVLDAKVIDISNSSIIGTFESLGAGCN